MADLVDSLNRLRRMASRRAGVALARFGIIVERTVKSQSLEALLVRRLAQIKRVHGQFFFLQIGANDGFSHDPINAFVTANRVAGIVVEPLPDMYKALCETYRKHPQIRKLNVAIHEELDHVTLYRPDPERVGRMSGIASLNQDRHELTSTRTGIRAEDIIAVEVPAVSLSELLKQERVEHLDLLQIDTEGYDMKILAGLDLARCRPSIIRFEHGIYSGVPARDELRETLLRLYDHGYSIAMERVDALAWLHEDVSKSSRRSDG
jgi:FkbM family methyltransferase